MKADLATIAKAASDVLQSKDTMSSTARTLKNTADEVVHGGSWAGEAATAFTTAVSSIDATTTKMMAHLEEMGNYIKKNVDSMQGGEDALKHAVTSAGGDGGSDSFPVNV